MNSAITILLVLNLCHWVGDFTHATRPGMLAAKMLGKPLLPIAAHALVHTVLMALACWVLIGANAAAIAVLIQFPTHFGIDVLKGRLNGWFPSLRSPMNVYHWYVFGADQLAHQVVIISIAFTVCPMP